MKSGYTYFDANGREFLYGGQFYLDETDWSTHGAVYKIKQEYLNSPHRAAFLSHRAEIEQHTKYKGSFLFLKMTKKNEKLIHGCKDMDDLLSAFVKVDFWDWYTNWKVLSNPLKVVKEGRKVIDPTVNNGFYCGSGTRPSGQTVSGWFCFEPIR